MIESRVDEFLENMSEELSNAYVASGDTYGAYHGHNAICYGLLAIVTELKNIRVQLEENA